MTHILAADPQQLVSKTAEALKQQHFVKPPVWDKFVKTGHHKDRHPESPDWWYFRSASVLRLVAKQGPIGTEKLRTKYGGKKNRGHQPEAFFKASGSIIRKILQQLEKSELIKQTQKGAHKGRVLTAKGTSFLDQIAIQLGKAEQQGE